MEWMCLFTTASICKGTVWTISTWIELSYINKWVSNDLVVGHPLRFCSSTVPDGTAIWKCWFKRAGGNRNIQKNTCCSKNRENQQQHSTQSMASYQEPEPRPNWWKVCTLGSITSRCSGKWAHTDQRPDSGDGGNWAYVYPDPHCCSFNYTALVRGSEWGLVLSVICP